MMRPSLAVLAVALLLAGLAASLASRTPSGAPRGDEATHRLMAESLVFDRDLAFDQRDLLRGYRIWDGGPAGLALVSRDEGRTFGYAGNTAYALLAAPWRAVAGGAGFALLNIALFAGMLLAAGAGAGEAGAGRFAIASLLGSALLGWVFRASPELAAAAAMFFALWLWRRGASAGAGALAGLAASLAPLSGLLAAALALDLALSRRLRPALGFVAAAVVAVAGLAAVARLGSGSFHPAAEPAVRRFEAAFPVETAAPVWAQTPPAASALSRPALANAPRAAWHAVVGRTTGLAAFFPFALASLACLGGRWERGQRLLALALAAGFVLLLVEAAASPRLPAPSGLGEGRWAALVPALLFLPRKERRGPEALAWAAAAIFTAPALLASLAPAPGVLPSPAFRALPLEVERLGGLRPGAPSGFGLPGYAARVVGDAVWLLPQDAFFTGEPNPRGVWMRGATAAEVFVVTPAPVERLTFGVRALAEQTVVTADGGGERLRVAFDTPGKREGVPLALAVAPVARDLEGFFPRETYYRLELCASDGLIPARRDTKSRDGRLLGVFLDFTPEGR